MKNKLILATLITLLFSGCTGVEIKTSPEASLLNQKFSNSYSTVGLLDASTGTNFPGIGNLTEAFSHEIRLSGVAKDVYYPARPDDKTEVIFESKFNTEFEGNSGINIAKSCFLGFTFLLFEPFVWYDYDYKFSGTVNVLKDGKLIKKSTAVTDTTISMKWLSLLDIAQVQNEAVTKAKKSLFLQLLNEIKK